MREIHKDEITKVIDKIKIQIKEHITFKQYFDTGRINDKLSSSKEEADKFLTEFNTKFEGKQSQFRENAFLDKKRDIFIDLNMETIDNNNSLLEDSLTLINNNPLYTILKKTKDESITSLDSYKNAKSFLMI